MTKELLIKNLSFRFTIFDNGSAYPMFWFSPDEVYEVVNYWSMEYRTSESVLTLINNIVILNGMVMPNNEIISSNENHIYIREKNKITFDVENVTGLKPVTISIDDFMYLFENYCNWLMDYENCRIPGLIPVGKLNSWIAVPRSAVKEEYFSKLKI